MKKVLVSMLLLVCTTFGAHAQFEKNKWFVDTSVTGLGLSYSKQEKTHFGFEANGGAFMADNLALLLSFGGDYGKRITDMTQVGVGGRYYFDKVGIFFGLRFKYKHFGDGVVKNNDLAASFDLGYAFFLSRTVTIEPAIYYDQSLLHHRDYSKVGFKIGFGFYF